MNILVTNEGGIFHPGTEVMVKVLQHFGKVYVICPAREDCRMGHSMRQSTPLKAVPTNLFSPEVSCWMVSGTPADCIRLGVEVLLEETPDFVFSGMSAGPNSGRDIYYSDTVTGAKEAALCDIPAAAVSLASFENQKVDFQQAASFFNHVTEVILRNIMPRGTFLNINLPMIPLELCQGVSVIPLDTSLTRYRYVGLKDNAGQMYYWLQDDYHQIEIAGKGADFHLLREGYVTISPVEVKFNQKRKVDRISNWFRSFSITEGEFFHV